MIDGLALKRVLSVCCVLAAMSCGTDDRVAELERRVDAIETSIAEAQPGEPLGSRSLQGGSDALAQEGERTLLSTVEAAFSDSPFLGEPLDTEFGGLVIELSDQGAVIVQMVGDGLLDESVLLALLEDSGASDDELRLVESATTGELILDGPVRAVEWDRAPDTLTIALQ